MKDYMIMMVVFFALVGVILGSNYMVIQKNEVSTEYLEKGDVYLEYSEQTTTTKYANRYANIASMYYLRHMIENNLSD